MATSNAIAIKRLEQERDLKLQELKQNYALKLRELELGEETLAETIRNNLRNYNINLSKNQIQKIANDQLDERESRKVLETIRHNLETELETKRSNMANEDIKRVEAEIKRLDTILQGAKPVGKDAASIALSGLMSQGMLSALGLPTIADMSFIQDYLAKGKSAKGLGGKVDEYTEEGIIQYTNDDGVVDAGLLKGRRFVNHRGGYSGGGVGGGTRGSTPKNYKSGNNYNRNKVREKEEFVEDFTYPGPDKGGNNSETNVVKAENSKTSGSGTTGHQSISESGEQASGKSTGESSSSKVYYSPGSKSGPGWFL